MNNNLLSAFFVVAAAKEEETEEDEDAVVAWMPPRYHRCANCVAPRRVLCADAILSSSYIYVFMYLYVCVWLSCVLIRKVKREGFCFVCFLLNARRQQGRKRKRDQVAKSERRRREEEAKNSKEHNKNLFKKKRAKFSPHARGSLCLRARTRELIARKHTRRAHTCIREETLTEREREREKEKREREKCHRRNRPRRVPPLKNKIQYREVR